MGLDVGGFHDRPDWPKMGPSLLITTSLSLAVRTARWPAQFDISPEKEPWYRANEEDVPK